MKQKKHTDNNNQTTKPTPSVIDPAHSILSIDFGGTFIKAGIVQQSKKGPKVIGFQTLATQREKGSEKVLENLRTVIDGMLLKLPKEDSEPRVRVGVPGRFKKENALYNNKLELKEKELYTFLTKNYSKDIRFINDSTAFTLAEATIGEARKYDIVLGITLGTGFGSGLIIHKKPYVGRLNAVESYHFPIEYDGKVMRADDILSEKGLVMIANKNSINVRTAKELYDMPNKETKEVFRIFSGLLAEMIFNMTLLFDPEVVVIGGGVSNSFDRFEKYLVSELKEKNLPQIPKIVKSKLDHAGIIGASLI